MVMDAPAPAVLSATPTEEQMLRLEAAIKRNPAAMDVAEITSHFFCSGLYARSIDVPAGTVIVGKKHATENFFLLMYGEMTVWTPEGMKRVNAPFLTVTKPGDKRVGYAHTRCMTINFWPNADDCSDPEILEARHTIPERTLTDSEVVNLLEDIT